MRIGAREGFYSVVRIESQVDGPEFGSVSWFEGRGSCEFAFSAPSGPYFSLSSLAFSFSWQQWAWRCCDDLHKHRTAATSSPSSWRLHFSADCLIGSSNLAHQTGQKSFIANRFAPGVLCSHQLNLQGRQAAHGGRQEGTATLNQRKMNSITSRARSLFPKAHWTSHQVPQVSECPHKASARV